MANVCYVSPIPAEIRPDYRKRRAGTAVTRRVHLFPQPDGRTVACNPDACRECARERQCEETHVQNCTRRSRQKHPNNVQRA